MGIQAIAEISQDQMSGWQKSPNIEAELLAQLQSHYQKVQSTNSLRLYWQDELGGELPVLSLPLDKPRTATQAYQKASHTFDIDEELTYKLKALSPSDDPNSFFITLLAGFKTLLYRLSGQKDIVVVTPTNMPFSPKEKRLSDYTISPLILRTTLSGNLGFVDCLDFVEQTVNEAVLLQEYPYELILEKSGKTTNPPIFQVMFAWEALPPKHKQWVEAIGIERQVLDSLTLDQFDLTLIITETERNLIVSLQYNQELFDQSTIARIAGNFQTLLQGIIATPAKSIALLPLLTESELHQLLVEWNNTQVEYPQYKCIHHLFEDQVERTPDAIAVMFENEQITYRDLNSRANQLGHYLRSLGVKPDVLVGICVERSIEMIVGLLGILKSGGAYVPLDPAYPSDRLAYMVEDSKLLVLVTQQSLLTTCAGFMPSGQPHAPVIFSIDSDWEQVIQYSRKNPITAATVQNLAYTIYTSGSTGKPKGVQLEHRSVFNFLVSMTQAAGIIAGDVFVSVASISFDMSVLDLYITLTVGATLVVASREATTDGSKLIQQIERSQASVMQATPATWQIMLASGWQGNKNLKVLSGGEPLTRKLAAQLLEKTASVWNLYGPTETTVYSTVYEVKSAEQKIFIGRPIANTEIYILDAHLQGAKEVLMLSPIGKVGELHIGGDGLARGYLNRPDLTEQKFISYSLTENHSSRIYKTGDLARYLPDGNLECLGRIDHQVKIRGFRIEIGEIETLLTKHPSIAEAVVVARKESNGNKRLVAYLVQKPETRVEHQENHTQFIPQLRSFLKEKVADYMVPSNFVIMDNMPLTPNGKINRLALPAPGHDRPALEVAYIAPRNSIEEKLAKIWAKILEIEPVGVEDNFFDLGGNSILIAQILNRVREVFEVDVAMSYFFDNPTVNGLAETINLFSQPTGEEAIKKSVDLQAEAILDDSIHASSLLKPIAMPTNILLTGATGYLGAFLLHELLQKTQANIYCLVRAANIKECQQKIQKNLERYLLEHKDYTARIIPIIGDLAQPLFGLSASDFSDLADTIDVIYHNGAYVNLVYPYSALKATNVLGTQEVLRLASQTKLKPVHYVSTVSVFESDRYAAMKGIKEDDQVENGDGLYDGYAQSKWVAEKLLHIAYARGIPFTMYRPGMIAGHSKTGASNITDINCRLMKAFVDLGTAPDIELPIDMTAADYVSGAIVHLSMQESSIGKTFHLVSPQGVPVNRLVNEINMIGYPIAQIPFELWKTQLIAKSATDNSLSVLLPLVTENVPGTNLTYLEVSSLQTFDCQNTLNGLANSAIACPPVNSKLLATYFAYFNLCGFINEAGKS